MNRLEDIEAFPRFVATPRPLRILLAEDNKFNQILVSKYIALAGWSLQIVDDGRAAVEAVRMTPDPFDLVLMDIRMPVMDGTEAALAIRALPGRRGDVSILAFTANTSNADHDAYLSAGIDGVIPKPMSRESLFAAIAAAVDCRPLIDAGSAGTDGLDSDPILA